jgi:hypothetical protein
MYHFRLQPTDGSPADPPTVRTAAPTRPGDTIPLGRDRSLRVIGARPGGELDEETVLVVETV